MSEFYEFGSMDAADAAREEYSDHVCPVDDDKRKKEVAFVSDTPGGVLDEIEAKALESRKEGKQRSQMSPPLSQPTRDKISDLGGFEDNTTFNWRSARGVFEREGIPMSRFGEMLSTLADYDDPVEGAEAEIARLREADAARGTSSLSGDGSVGEEDILEDQRAAKQARQAQQITGEQCSRAEEECEAGEREACEFLQEVCGVDEDVIHDLLLDPPEDPGAGELPDPEDGADAVDVDRLAGLAEGPVDPRGRIETALSDGDTAGAIEGAALGALKRSWSGYQAGVSNAEDALDQLREQWEYAQQAANAINSIRDAHGQDPLHFDRLEEFNADLSDFVRKVARDCEECHADHSEHDHGTDTGDTEDMQQAVLSGFEGTPVGTSTATETAEPEFVPDLDLGMDPIDPRDRMENIGTDADQDAPEARYADLSEMDPAAEGIARGLNRALRNPNDDRDSVEDVAEYAARKVADPDTDLNRFDLREIAAVANSNVDRMDRIEPGDFVRLAAGMNEDSGTDADLDLGMGPIDPRGRMSNVGMGADQDAAESGTPDRELRSRMDDAITEIRSYGRERRNTASETVSTFLSYFDGYPEVQDQIEGEPSAFISGKTARVRSSLEAAVMRARDPDAVPEFRREFITAAKEMVEDGIEDNGADLQLDTDTLDPRNRQRTAIDNAAEPATADLDLPPVAESIARRLGEALADGNETRVKFAIGLAADRFEDARRPDDMLLNIAEVANYIAGIGNRIPPNEFSRRVYDRMGVPDDALETRSIRTDTETLDPRGRIEAAIGGSDPDISDLPNGFEFVGTEEYGDDMTFYNWVAPSKLPGEQTESISIRETREDYTIYAGPGDDRNLMNSGFENFAAAYDAAAELADGMGTARRRPAGGRTGPGDVIETDPQQSLGGGRANDQARLAGGERGDVETEIESTDAENPGGMMADTREDTADAPTGENTEQQVPDAFQVPEGGQDSLTDF